MDKSWKDNIKELSQRESIKVPLYSKLTESIFSDFELEEEGYDEYSCYYYKTKEKTLPDGTRVWIYGAE